MERAQKLFDCLTQIGDKYLEEAQAYRPAVPLNRRRQRWAALAAAAVLVLGLSRIPGMLRMGSANTAAPSTPSAAPPAPGAAAPAASAPDLSDAQDFPSQEGESESQTPPSGSGGTDSSHPNMGVSGGEDQLSSYARMAVSENTVLIAEAAVTAAREEGSYTRLTLELTDVLKGDAGQGETVSFLSAQPFLEGERAVWFLPEMDEQPLALDRGAVMVDGDQALVWSAMVDGQGTGQVWMELEEFKELIRQALE